MGQDTWSAVEEYVTGCVVMPDDALERSLAKSAEAGLPEIQVPPGTGKLLHLLARSMGAKRILEVGTLGGYSTIWMARGLADGGKLITLERDPHHAKVARDNFEHAGVNDRVELIEGPALESLEQIAAQSDEPFDLVFIDADKPSNPDYFTWALKLTHVGSIIIVDNVVRDGEVIDATSKDESVQGVRKLNDLIAAGPRVSATTLQTVSSKGYDGFTLALVCA
ncbi:MAG: O-methyltransferase [Phycisphaerae bacterium]|nr:MAG: O-methyltransferase [Phycisphaerae bacterium]